MTGRLQDKVAFVTGAGAMGPGWGNGKATAVLFAREIAAANSVPELKALYDKGETFLDYLVRIGADIRDKTESRADGRRDAGCGTEGEGRA